VTVIRPGAGEIIGDAPDRRVEILCEQDAVHATWSRFGPRRDGADLHVHRHHSDLFYVLDGELTVRLGLEDRAVPAPAGTLVRVPPMVVHGFRNASDADVLYLNFHMPGTGFADYMRGLRDGLRVPFDQEDPPPDGIRPASEVAIGAPSDPIEVVTVEHGLDIELGYVLDGELAIDGQRAPAGSWIENGHAATGAARVLLVTARPSASR
jgi:mannose-6-phosphate isomerase-like protein (cupin superfamily)